jgi:hypothetical protein
MADPADRAATLIVLGAILLVVLLMLGVTGWLVVQP